MTNPCVHWRHLITISQADDRYEGTAQSSAFDRNWMPAERLKFDFRQGKGGASTRERSDRSWGRISNLRVALSEGEQR